MSVTGNKIGIYHGTVGTIFYYTTGTGTEISYMNWNFEIVCLPTTDADLINPADGVPLHHGQVHLVTHQVPDKKVGGGEKSG